jgi:hypothetical protein
MYDNLCSVFFKTIFPCGEYAVNPLHQTCSISGQLPTMFPSVVSTVAPGMSQSMRTSATGLPCLMARSRLVARGGAIAQPTKKVEPRKTKQNNDHRFISVSPRQLGTNGPSFILFNTNAAHTGEYKRLFVNMAPSILLLRLMYI